MNYSLLLSRAKQRCISALAYEQRYPFQYLFSNGIHWMAEQFDKKLSDAEIKTIANYAWLKYSFALVLSFSPLIWLQEFTWVFVIPYLLLFYWIESHFFFLVPLLIHQVKNPIKQSICLTYRIGVLKVYVYCIRLAVFMISGLFNFRNPIKNWLIGCLAVTIWFKDAHTNR